MFVEFTKSICPVCKVVVDAEVNVRNNRVYLRKRCKEHGPFEALVYSDAQMWFDSQRFNKPKTIPLKTHNEVDQGCPLDCGFCPDHKQLSARWEWPLLDLSLPGRWRRSWCV